jgi:hypothetical protein
MTNYRGINLMSTAAKVYNRVLLNRIRAPIDAILRKSQAWFRVSRSCIQQIHILRRIIESASKFRLYNAACISILLYGCESWVLTEKDRKKLDVFHRTCLRIIMGHNQNENHTHQQDDGKYQMK